MTPGFTTHESSRGRKQKRTLNTPVSPWEISDTYSELQMSAILMNTPKIWFLGIRFLRTALKNQHSLAGVVLQNRQETDLLIPEQGGTWVILNETCHFWVNTSSQVKESLTVLKKNILDATGPQRISWRVLGVATISLWGFLLLAMGNLKLANAPTNPCYHHIDAAYHSSMYHQLSNSFCLCPGQQATIHSASLTRIYKITAGHGNYHSLLDGHD